MVDILLATYNGGVYINELLDSLDKQTYKNWRLIARDDNSTDNTWECLKKFKQEHKAGKVVLFKNQPSTGTAKANFFLLLKDAVQPYIMFCDQDDVWKKDKVEITLRTMKNMEKKYSSNKPLLVHTDLEVVDERLNTISKSFLKYMNLKPDDKINDLMIQNVCTGCTEMINKKLADYVKDIGDTDKILMHDQWMALVASAFGHIQFVPQATILYRQHGNNSVGASNALSPMYILSKLKSGKSNFRCDMRKSTEQMAFFLKVYEDKISNKCKKDMLRQYSELFSMDKLDRIVYYINWHVLKQGILRKFMQMVWG